MSKLVRRCRQVLRRFFLRIATGLCRRCASSSSSTSSSTPPWSPEHLAILYEVISEDYTRKDENAFLESTKMKPKDQSTLPNFSTVITDYGALLQTIPIHQGLPDSMKESRSFRLSLYCIVYRFLILEYLSEDGSSRLKRGPELTRMGFFPLYSGEDNDNEFAFKEKVITEMQKEQTALGGLVHEGCLRGFDRDIVSAMSHACQYNCEIRRLAKLADDEAQASKRWDLVLRYIVEAVILLHERDKVWPSWPDLEPTRQQIMSPEKVHGFPDDHEAELIILLSLLHLADNCLPVYADDICKYVNFHPRHLNHELCKMSKRISEHSSNEVVQTMGRLIGANDTEFCELFMERLLADQAFPTRLFVLRLYRLCMSLKVWDSGLEEIFRDKPNRRQVIDKLIRCQTSLSNDPRQPTELTHENDDNDDHDTGLPELSPIPVEYVVSHKDTPWWVNAFKQKSEKVPAEKNEGLSYRTPISETVEPSSTSIARWELEREKREQIVHDPASENRQVARWFATNDSISDNDTCNILFSYITADVRKQTSRSEETYRDISHTALRLLVRKPITLKWGSQERKLNIEADVNYHCRVLTYHPVQNEWTIKSDISRINHLLETDREGASCVPLAGDCGESRSNGSCVFKIHKSLSDYAPREYMADVRVHGPLVRYQIQCTDPRPIRSSGNAAFRLRSRLQRH